MTIPKVKAVKIKQHRNIPEGYKLKSVTISQTPSGKYFASVLFEYESNVPSKLQEMGKQLVKIDKWFPSSKTCSCCGVVKQSLSLSERTYICDCGVILDRDINASNQYKKGSYAYTRCIVVRDK